MLEQDHVREAIEAEYYLKGKAASDAQNESENAVRDNQRAEYLRSQNIPEDVISEMLAIR